MARFGRARWRGSATGGSPQSTVAPLPSPTPGCLSAGLEGASSLDLVDSSWQERWWKNLDGRIWRQSR